MPKQDTKRGQIILETLVVVISIVTIVLYSIARFSNSNLDMIGRMNMYRDTRVQAVNNLGGISYVAPGEKHTNPLDPLTYLDYPFHSIITIPDVDTPGDFKDEFFEDPRMRKAELLMDEFDDIINVVLPFKINEAYQLLGGDECDDDGCILGLSYDAVRRARDILGDLIKNEANYNRYGRVISNPLDDIYSAPRAYQDFFEDTNGVNRDRDSDVDRNGNGFIDTEDANHNGVLDSGEDRNGNGLLDDESEFLGAAGWLQRVLDDPVENGPFDPDLECQSCLPDDQACLRQQQICINRQNSNINNRTNLQQSINSMLSTKQGIDNLFYGYSREPGLIRRLTTAYNNLNAVVNNWNEQHCHWTDCWLLRPGRIRTARDNLKFLLDFVGTVDTLRPSEDLAILIQTTYSLLVPPVSYVAVNDAYYNCDRLLNHPEIIGNPPRDTNGDPPFQPFLYNMISEIQGYLWNVIFNFWGDPTGLDIYYMNLARQKLQILYDIVTGAY